MYSATPAAKQAWRAIFQWALARTGLSWTLHDHDPPAPLAALWARDDLGCVMMCGLPYRERHPRPTLVAAPVPAPARYGGKPIYFTDIAVRADAAFARLEDTFGGVAGFTLRESLSGYAALRAHLLPYRRAAGVPLYRRTLGGYLNAKAVIEAIADGTIDVGPLDSFHYALLAKGAPALAANVRIIATTGAAPIPPLVASPAVAATDLARLRAALCAVGEASELRDSREVVLLERFAVPAESDYRVIDAIRMDAARYPDPW